MSWILMLLTSGTPNPVPLLGDDDWRTRERTHSRLDNLLCHFFLPRTSPDPEIQARLNAIHRKWDRFTSLEYYERIEQRADYWKWFDKYIVQGRSRIDSPERIFGYLHSNFKEANELRGEFFRKYPLRPGETSSWLVGAMFPGEFRKFMTHLDRFNVKLQVMKQIGDAFLPYPTELP